MRQAVLGGLLSSMPPCKLAHPANIGIARFVIGAAYVGVFEWFVTFIDPSASIFPQSTFSVDLTGMPFGWRFVIFGMYTDAIGRS